MKRLLILTCALALTLSFGESFAVADGIVLIAKGSSGGGHGNSGRGGSGKSGPGSDSDSSGRGNSGTELHDDGRHHDGELELRGREAEGEVEHGVETEHNRNQGR